MSSIIATDSTNNSTQHRWEFATSRVRFVEHMGFLEVFSFCGEGIGGALFIAGMVLQQPVLVALGIGAVFSAVIALLMHLGSRALLSWRALRMVRTSWVSRGSLFISLFMLFSMSYVVSLYANLSIGLQNMAMYLADVCAVLVIIYAGMMLRSMKAVVLWRSLYLPAAFVLHSSASALVVSFVYIAVVGQSEPDFVVKIIALLLLLCSAAVSAIHVVSAKKTPAIQSSIHRMFSGIVSKTMLWGALVCGIVVPVSGLVLSVFFPSDSIVYSALLIIVVFSRLYGDYAYRLSIVKCGAYEPIVPPRSRA